MYWDIAVATSQALVYVAVAGVIGGGFSLWLLDRYVPEAMDFAVAVRLIKHWIWGSIILGAIFASAGYLMFIGSINQTGVPGMFDGELIVFLLYDPPGKVAISQLIVFSLLAGLLPFIARKPVAVVYCFVAVVLATTFILRGHLASAPAWAQVLLILHVLSMSVWAGALLPLWLLARGKQIQQWQLVFEKFGYIAQIVVGTLMLSGLIMLVYLLASPIDLFNSRYGIAVTLKLVIVVLLLACAAANKWFIVPYLHIPERARWLARVIHLEMLCVMLIFSLTATFTVVIGRS
ncbi:putative copper export protein [Idiomarina sp. A28L]|uniref:copper resistance D family protein n=1 Tax=Idiomarina sp. A28L TaxID=1036674 RepID=UPI0002138715|nr:CopD family protein [Idiomarina sp. A28L]EGN74799.1 putative copper export protein [Idiomarina sp. A28L]